MLLTEIYQSLDTHLQSILDPSARQWTKSFVCTLRLTGFRQKSFVFACYPSLPKSTANFHEDCHPPTDRHIIYKRRSVKLTDKMKPQISVCNVYPLARPMRLLLASHFPDKLNTTTMSRPILKALIQCLFDIYTYSQLMFSLPEWPRSACHQIPRSSAKTKAHANCKYQH